MLSFFDKVTLVMLFPSTYRQTDQTKISCSIVYMEGILHLIQTERPRFRKKDVSSGDSIYQPLKPGVSETCHSRAEGNTIMSLVITHYITGDLTLDHLPLSRCLSL